MKYLPNLAGIVLGLLFIMASSMVLFHLAKMPPLPAGSPQEQFMAVFGSTGWLTFVKVFEMLGGLLVLIPRTRNIGLLILGPIIVNILAYHAFVMKGEGLFSPMLILICLLALYLLWADRRKWASLVS